MNDKHNSSKKLGRFVIKDEDENESISAGTLFAHRKDFVSLSSIVNTSGRNNTVQESSQEDAFLKKDVRGVFKNMVNATIKQSQTRSTDVDEVNGVSSHDNSAKQKENISVKKLKKKHENPLKKLKLMGKPFGQLLDGVVLVISGYQNPLRSNLRTMALEMGARYKPDWDNTCTHLICAFPHTPKFQQVWGKGYIVRKEWVENCHSKRKRLPWRRYALDKRDLSKPESEDEIPELIQNLTSMSPELSSDDGHFKSESDTEDEIERIRGTNPRGDDETDVDIDTDIPDTSNIPLPHLLSIFKGKCFYLSDELCHETKYKLHRYIVALDGLLSSYSEDDQVDIVISERKMKTKHLVVKPEWIWECNDAGRLLPTKMFEIY